MTQLKIIIKFNTSSIKQEKNKDDEILKAKHNINIEENIVDNKNKTFSNLNNLGRKKKH